MKKLLILLFSLLISFNSYSEEVILDFSSDTFCVLSPKVQIRNGLFYLPNTEKPYSGENICVYLSNGQYYSRGRIKNGRNDGTWSYWNENGQLFMQGNFKNGIEFGKSTRWNWDGSKESETDETDSNVKITNWYTNGLKKSEYILNKQNNVGKFTYWFNNGQIESVINYKDDKKDGKWMIWDKSGQIQEVSNWKNGKKLVTKTEYHDDGLIEKELVYEDGKLVSEIKYTYNKFGQIKNKWRYIDEKLVGQTDYYYFKTGQIEKELNWMGKHLNGKSTWWYSNSQIITDHYYNEIRLFFSKDRLYKKIRSFDKFVVINFKSEKLKEKAKKVIKKQFPDLIVVKNRELDLEITIEVPKYIDLDASEIFKDSNSSNWNNISQIEIEANYKNGKLEGTKTEFYPNGNKKSEGYYINDKRDGNWSNWNYSGQITSAGVISNDKILNSTILTYHPSGKKRSEKNLKNNMKNGKQKYWNENGLITSESNWKDGECISGDCPS